MKNLLIVVLFLKCFFCFSQNSKNDIYIFIAKKPSIEVVNDSILFQKFVIDYNTDYKGKEVKLSIDKNGDLIKNIRINTSRNNIIYLIYKNEREDNIPVLVHKAKIRNVLFYDEIKESIESENFYEIVLKYNIYIIENNQNDKDYYIAKKVVLEKPTTL